MSAKIQPKQQPNYRERVYAVVRKIPYGKVATYGQVARMAGAGITARMVGYALAALSDEKDVPWQRVINHQGKISPHGYGFGSAMQETILREEGVQFSPEGVIDFNQFGWQG